MKIDPKSLLAKIEAELAATDRADEQIAEHAAAMADRIQARLWEHRRKLRVTGNDDASEREYLHLLGQKRRAELVHALARRKGR